MSENIQKKEFIFDKRQTNIAKGVALLLLLWHHLFYNDPNNYDMFVSLFNVKGMPIECLIANFCKVCVAIFLFLSGYGLYKSYNSYLTILKNSNNRASVKNDLIYIKNHLLKLLSQYWFVYIIFVSMGFAFGRNPIQIYKGNFLYFILDFFGLANIFNTPTMNGTWWFMSLIILLYMIYPLIHRVLKWCPGILLLSAFAFLLFYYLPDISGFRIYSFSFILGVYFSYKDIFVLIKKQFDTFIKVIFICMLSLFISLWLKAFVFMNGAEIEGFFSSSIILTSFLIISRIPVINLLLEQLGKYSGPIFMFHTFIFSYYFNNFIYSFKYSILIYLVMVVICFVIAVLLSYLQKIVGYDKIINIITK